MTVADTGFVVALVNQYDSYHTTVKQAYAKQKQILLPQTVLAEVAYLLHRDAGTAQLVRFLESLSNSRFQPICLIEQDFARIATILKQYQDSRIDICGCLSDGDRRTLQSRHYSHARSARF